MKLRFREWGSEDWTLVDVKGELDDVVLGVLGASLSRFHCQLLVDGKWENLGQ